MQQLPLSEEQVRSRPERVYFCAYCGALITTESCKDRQDGSFDHTFANPAGYVFRIGCFREATGCLTSGQYTMEHTWFAGCQWCYALCASCASHLGWHYRGPRARAFYGLILERLIAEGD